MNTSFTEENYLKTIYKLTGDSQSAVSTNSIAEILQTKASSVTDMIKKLCDKKLLDHTRYQGVKLTGEGKRKALEIVRKHRLWEVFLVDRLGMGWEIVHDIAEQLEHTSSDALYEHLDKFLDYPRFDPHGDPIPDNKGKVERQSQVSIADLAPGSITTVAGVKDHLPDFLQFLQEIGLTPGSQVSITRRFDFDGSTGVCVAGGKEVMISRQVAASILVKP
jgi:DtxR family Mn-dependent transcriptional regulator